MAAKIDDLLNQLGKPGRYQLLIYLLLCLNYFPISFNHLVMAFYGAKTNMRCNAPDQFADMLYDGVGNVGSTNGSVEVSVVAADICANIPTNNTSPDVTSSGTCPYGWSFDVADGETNIITEWNLTCGSSYLRNLATTIYFLGVMVGGIVYGFLADEFGRRPVFLSTLSLPIIVGAFISYSQNYVMFVLLRFVQGILMQGLQNTTYVLIMELLVPRYRTYAGAIVEVFWACGIMTLAGIAYFIQDWRLIQLAITIPSVLTITYFWIIPESLRWLYLKRKFTAATTIVRHISKFNHIEYPEETVSAVEWHYEIQLKQSSHQFTVIDLIKTPIIRRRSIILFYIWMVLAVCYYGLSFNVTSLAGNKYLNFFIAGAVELPAYIAAIYILERFGRKRPLCIYFLIGGAICIIAGIIQLCDSSLSKWATALALCGKFAMAGAFSGLFLHASELFPTAIRNVGIGACAFWLRFGGVLAPQVLLLGEYTFQQLPVIIFGVLSISAGVLTLLLPETLNQKLPDTIEQIEKSCDMSHDYEVDRSCEDDDAQVLKPLNSEENGVVTT